MHHSNLGQGYSKISSKWSWGISLGMTSKTGCWCGWLNLTYITGHRNVHLMWVSLWHNNIIWLLKIKKTVSCLENVLPFCGNMWPIYLYYCTQNHTQFLFPRPQPDIPPSCPASCSCCTDLIVTWLLKAHACLEPSNRSLWIRSALLWGWLSLNLTWSSSDLTWPCPQKEYDQEARVLLSSFFSAR